MHTIRRLSALLLTSVPALALAHPGHGAVEGLAAGLAHPLLGVDHLAAAMLTGAWAIQRGGRARIALPTVFIALLTAGIAASPLLDLAAGPLEHAIAASILLTGVALAFAWRLPTPACLALTGSFAFVHGIAHGAEQPGGSLLAYGAGLVLATAAALLVADIAAQALLRRSGPALLRWIGAAGMALGAGFLALA